MTDSFINSTVPYLLGILSILFAIGTWQMWKKREADWKGALIKQRQNLKTFAFMLFLSIAATLIIAFSAIFWGTPLMTGKSE